MFLITEGSLCGLIDYLRNKDKEGVHGALFAGDLGIIASQVMLLSNPFYFKTQEPGIFEYFGR